MVKKGSKLYSFSIATTERQKDGRTAGNWTDKTEWHNLVAFTKLAEIVRDYVKKGSKLYIEGRLNTRSWEDKDSKKKVYRTEIIVNDLSLLSAREEGAGGYSKSQSSSSSSASFDQRPPAAAGGSDEYSQQAEISDDDARFDEGPLRRLHQIIPF
jgi:single-strand DNA-binding protein